MDILILGFGIKTITLKDNDNALLCSHSVIKDMEYKLDSGDETILEIYRYRKEIDKRFTYEILNRGGDLHKYITDGGVGVFKPITQKYRFQHIHDINYADKDCLFLIQFNTETYSDQELRLRFRKRQGHIQCRPFTLITGLKQTKVKTVLGDKLKKSRKQQKVLRKRLKNRKRVILDNKKTTGVLKKQNDELVKTIQTYLKKIDGLNTALGIQKHLITTDGRNTALGIQKYENDQIRKKLEAEEEMRHIMKQQLETYVTQLTEHQVKMKDQKLANEKANERFESDQFRLKEYRNEIDALKTKLNSQNKNSTSDIENKQNHIMSLEREKQKLVEAINEYVIEINGLNTELGIQKHLITTDGSNTALGFKKYENDQIRKKLEAEEEMRHIMKQQLETYETQLTEHQVKMKDQKLANEKANERIKSNQFRLKEFRNEIDALKTELNSQNKKSTSDIENKQNHIMSLEREKQKLVEAINEYVIEIDDLNTELGIHQYHGRPKQLDRFMKKQLETFKTRLTNLQVEIEVQKLLNERMMSGIY